MSIVNDDSCTRTLWYAGMEHPPRALFKQRKACETVFNDVSFPGLSESSSRSRKLSTKNAMPALHPYGGLSKRPAIFQ